MNTRAPTRTRRDFLRSSVAAGGVLAFGTPSGKSRVVIARNPSPAGDHSRLDSSEVLGLLDRSMQSFYDRDDPAEAWRRLVGPEQTVGLKINCLAGKGISTSSELVEAVCERLQESGIPAGNIIIWDRLSSDLENAGFRVKDDPNRIRCIGNDQIGFESELAGFGSAGSLVSKAMTQLCDVVISLPVLKDHGITGVTMALKNLFGAIHNPNKYHMNAGDPYVADVFMLPPIRRKVRLTICDATTAQYEGGPSFMPQWTWPYHGLIVASDPVALDQTGWGIIEQKRAEKGMKSLSQVGRRPRYIERAADAEHRIGTDDPARIEVIKV